MDSEITKLLYEFVEDHRPPAEVRDQLDIGYRVENQSVFIVEIRPDWQKPGEKREFPVAKATYVKSNRLWKVFWMRADLKWHLYEPHPYALDIKDFLDVVGEDKLGCFWG